MKNFEELKEAIKGNSFNESHLSKTQVVDLETVIGLIEDFEQCNIANVGKRIFIVFAQRKDPLNEARQIIKVFTKESEAVIWIADNNPKKYYYEVHKVG